MDSNIDKKIVILFTESNQTKWKEFVNSQTVSDKKKRLTWFNYDVESVEFYRFSEILLNNVIERNKNKINISKLWNFYK